MNTNSLKEVRTYKILNGPNADRLFDACRYAYDKDVKIPLEFGIVIGYSAPEDNPGRCAIGAHACKLRITSVEHEDGSGTSFNVGGYCESFKKGPYDKPLFVGCRVRIYYNSHTRKGNITFCQ